MKRPYPADIDTVVFEQLPYNWKTFTLSSGKDQSNRGVIFNDVLSINVM